MKRVLAFVTIVAAMAVPATAQTPSAATKASRPFVPPKTPWGEPDLQGIYSNRTITPFERPAQFAGKAELSNEEIADLERGAAERSVDNARNKGTEGDVSSAYNEFW